MSGMEAIIRAALGRLSQQVEMVAPPLLAALMILAATYLVAVVVRWCTTRLFKGIKADLWLRRSGISFMLDRRGRIRASRVVASSLFWIVIAIGVLTAVNVFETELTTTIVRGAVFLLPKLLAAGTIVVGGAWLGQYLGRSTLVWAVNEGVGAARKLSMAVRVGVVFASVVVAADYLDFARSVFLAAFIIVTAGVMLAAALAVGLGTRDTIRRYLMERSRPQEREEERSLWSHL